MMMGEFSESEYFSGYKSIRNGFRKFDPLALVNALIGFLRRPAKNALEELQKHPWAILLLIKWILIDEQYEIGNRPLPRDNDVIKLINKMFDLAGNARLPSQYDHLILFLRSIAYQQFLYQHNFSIVNFSRQYLLFADLPDNHTFKVKFAEISGLSVSKFLDLAFMTLTRFIDEKENDLPFDWFNSVRHKYSDEDISKFLSLISKSMAQIRGEFVRQDSGRRRASEYYEQTAFFRMPLVRSTKAHLCLNRRVLFRCLEHYLYDSLKERDAQAFMNEFGSVFERYVEKAVKHAGLPYINENQLKKELGANSSLIDFIVHDGDANVYIDAKGVEMATLGKVAYTSEIVRERSKVSIKALWQAHEVINKLLERSALPFGIDPRRKSYLLVLSFKELYLGTGRTLYDAIAKEEMDELYETYKVNNIQMDDIYFMTIEEFEYLTEVVKSKKIGLVQAIERAKLLDKDPKTRKFNFIQHVLEWDVYPEIPAYLHERATAELEKIRLMLPGQVR